MNLPFSVTFFKKIDIFHQIREMDNEKKDKHLLIAEKAVLDWAASEHHQHLGSPIGTEHVQSALLIYISEGRIDKSEQENLNRSAQNILDSLETRGFGNYPHLNGSEDKRVKINSYGLQTGKVIRELKHWESWVIYIFWTIIWWVVLILGFIILFLQAAASLRSTLF